MTSAAPKTRPERLPEIDLAKGFAILCVIAIHAKVFEGTLVHLHIINRAVPLFLILFGMTSEMWWRSVEARGEPHPARRWYRARLSRMLPPMWAAVLAWWVIGDLAGSLRIRTHLYEFLISFTSYAPWIGTFWFVTLIAQIVLLFPLLRRLWTAIGVQAALVLGAVATFLSVLYMWETVELGQAFLDEYKMKTPFYLHWIFSPRVLLHVTAGFAIARAAYRPSPKATAICWGLVLLGPLAGHLAKESASNALMAPLYEQLVQYVLDIPLALGLLGLLRWIQLPQPAARFLAWCGVSSWGLYLGHALVFEVVQLYHRAPETKTETTRLFYWLVLFGSAVVLTWVGSRIGDRIARVWSRPPPAEHPAAASQ